MAWSTTREVLNFTDIADPTPNRRCARLGYRAVGEPVVFAFGR